MHISIETAGKLADVSRWAIYKMIKKRTIPCLTATALGRPSYRIPMDMFYRWLQKEAEGLEKRLSHLRKSMKLIEEKLRNG